MRWIGFDPGQTRCGVAVSDPSGILASPVAVLPVEPRITLAQRVALALEQYGAPLHGGDYAGLIGGLALDQRGREGESARLGRELTTRLHRELLAMLEPVSGTVEDQAGTSTAEVLELQFRDERFSSADMQRRRSAAGVSQRRQKDEIDAWAAAAVLQDFLDASRQPARD